MNVCFILQLHEWSLSPGEGQRVICPDSQMKIDINEYPELVERINETLSKGGVIELKSERSGIAAVVIKRELVAKEPYLLEKNEG